MLQVNGAIPTSSLELVLSSSLETKVVLGITAAFSLVSWFLIVLKWWQFRRIRRQATRFFTEIARSHRLQDAYHTVMKLPPSPFSRLFREGVTFFSDLRPGALKERPATSESLSYAQLEALKMVLGKEVGAEREAA